MLNVIIKIEPARVNLLPGAGILSTFEGLVSTFWCK